MTNLLQQATATFQQTSDVQAQMLLQAFTEQVLSGQLALKNNIHETLSRCVALLDESINQQLHAILSHDDLLKLEGAWRGIDHLCKQVMPNATRQLRILCASKSTLQQDFAKASCYDQSFCFKAIYEREFGTPGGQPYSLLLADYQFNHSDADLALLKGFAGVGSTSFCPILTAAAPSLFGFNDWQTLSKPRVLANIFNAQDYAAWRSFRASDDARFITLTMPRVLARANYNDGDRETAPCWMNAAYPLAVRIADAVRVSGWPVAIRGAENGGKVYDLPLAKGCSTEVAITDRREAELSQLGFLPLCHYKNTNFAVFFGSQTCHQAKQYDSDNASANAAIAARLPYLLTSSRIAHYLKVMARDKMGSFLEVSDAERWLNQWILTYVNGNPSSKQALKAKYPLAEAHIKVSESAANPGSYEATAWLRPWLQFEELTTSMRLVARLPQGK